MTPRQKIMSKAHYAVVAALRDGKLKPLPCETCGKTGDGYHRVVAHHDDYAQPLNVRWLCGSCHKHHHLKHGPGRFPSDIGAAA